MAVKGKYVYEWPRSMVTVDSVVFLRDKTGPKVLLIKRKKEPFRGRWVFPGGFLEMDEELADGAARELAEETGLVGVELEQMHTFGTCGRDPRGRVIGVAFVGTVGPDNAAIKAGDDAAEAGWFDIDQLPELAFDHDKIAKMAIEKMCGR
jgi:8-oxo-dGTP diphosphatase